MSNTQIVLDFIDAWNRMDWDTIVSSLTEDVVYHNIVGNLSRSSLLGNFGIVNRADGDGVVVISKEVEGEANGHDVACVVCAGGVRSLRAVHYLSWLGFPKVVSLNGGTAGWANAGRTIEGRVAAPSAGAKPLDGPERYIHGAS